MRGGRTNNDLERSRWKFFQVGLLVAAAMTVSAFEWTTFSTNHKLVVYEPIDEIPIEPTHIMEYVPSSQPKAKRVIPPVIEEIIEVEEFEEKEETPDVEIEDPIDLKEIDSVAQETEEGTVGIGFVDTVPIAGQMPYFPECKGLSKHERDSCTMKMIHDHLGKNVISPRNIRETSTLYMQFVVGTDGQVVSVKKIGEKGPGAKQGEASTARALKDLPRFVPGKQGRHKVAVKYVIPITFKRSW